MPGEMEPPQKKAPKIQLENLDGFKFKELLRNDTDRTRCVIHAEDPNGRSAVIIINKNSFEKEKVERILCKESQLVFHTENDIYGNYDLALPKEFAYAKTTVICPATEKHVEKYREQQCFVLVETAEDYEKLTIPFIKESQFSNKWVQNFLEHKAETDRVIFEDADPEIGFMLAPDLKWDGKIMDELYVTAIIHKYGIKSIRDLNTSHIPLLENVLKKSLEAIQEKYGIPSYQIKAYFHYQPSYYHLHVHFVHVMHDAPGIGAFGAHPVTTVIANIKTFPEYYQKSDLTFIRKVNDPLFKKFKDAGRV